MTTIPKPDKRLPMMGAIHRSLSVDMGDVTVIYNYDTTDIRMYIRRHIFRTIDGERVRTDRSISASSLDKALKNNTPLGDHVLTAHIDCGGTLNTYQGEDGLSLWAPTIGDSSAIALLVEAIPHFYEATSDTEERKSIRAVYHQLAKRAVPA